jgi:N-sulfoglucosamine sulfohydrolase
MLRNALAACCVVVAALLMGCAGNGAGNAVNHASIEQGYKPLFNGKDLSGWMYPTDAKGKHHKAGAGYQVRPEAGVLYCTATDGGRLLTDKEYDDFSFRFEFKLTPDANNGIAIRAAADGNPAYRGMEIQILDDRGSKYHAPNKELRPGQYHGSIYDVVPAKQGHQKPVGEWNEEEIIARGRHITVILNGAKIVDANLDDVKDEAVLAKHPGLHYPKGRIGLLGHGSAVEFRNLRIKEL